MSNLWVMAAWSCNSDCNYGERAPYFKTAEDYEQHMASQHSTQSEHAYRYPYSRADNDAMDAVHKSFKDAGLGSMFPDIEHRSQNGIDPPEADGELIHYNGVTAFPSVKMEGGTNGIILGRGVHGRSASADHVLELHHPADWAHEVPAATVHLGKEPHRAAEHFLHAAKHPDFMKAVSGQVPEWREAMEDNYGENVWDKDKESARQTYQGPGGPGRRYYDPPTFGAESSPPGWHTYDE